MCMLVADLMNFEVNVLLTCFSYLMFDNKGNLLLHMVLINSVLGFQCKQNALGDSILLAKIIVTLIYKDVRALG